MIFVGNLKSGCVYFGFQVRRRILDGVLPRLLSGIWGCNPTLNTFPVKSWWTIWFELFNFTKEVSICTLGPDFDHDGKVDVAKYMKITFGKVRPHISNDIGTVNIMLPTVGPWSECWWMQKQSQPIFYKPTGSSHFKCNALTNNQ